MHPVDPDAVPHSAFVLAEHHPAGAVPWHAHRRAQLLYVTEGVLSVRMEQGRWIVPPQRAMWVLPHIGHSVASSHAYRLRILFLDPLAAKLPSLCGVVDVDPLFRELLLAASEFGFRYAPGDPEERLLQVALDRLPTRAVSSLHLPEPRDPRLRALTETLVKDPADPRPLDELALAAGLTGRRAERLFQRQLGLTFGRWRQQLRLLVALEKLAGGETVADVARIIGYRDVSAFIAMFKSALGSTPAQYFRHTALIVGA